MMMMTTTKRTKIHEKEEKPNPGGGGGGGSTSTPPGPDRISELPIEILHRILGFLEMDEFLIGTSLVSTKWRNLWKSVSTLKFRFVDNFGDMPDNVEKDYNFVDHVLRLRDSEASKVQIFDYTWFYSFRGGYDYLHRLHNILVSAAVNQGAQEIQILCYYSVDENNNNNVIHFNPSIFTSGPGGLLRKFTFKVYTSDFLIQFPHSICCAAQLTHLSLYGIRLPEGGNDDSNAAQLHFVCPVLETLSLCNCYSKHLKVLDISAPRLNTLSICNFCMRSEYFDGLGGCRIEIRTPNLTSLEHLGNAYIDYFMEYLPRIVYASLKFTKEPGMVEKTTSFAIKLLKRLTSAESLTLGGFEDFSQDILKVLLTPFTILRTLKLVTTCEISSIHGVVHILNSCNSIEKLVWEVDEYYTVEGDEHLMLPQCSLSHLKHVHIKRLRGHENEIDFVKFLLKSSVVLEDIIINTARDSPKTSIEENLKQFIEEEPSVRRSIKLHIL